MPGMNGTAQFVDELEADRTDGIVLIVLSAAALASAVLFNGTMLVLSGALTAG